VAKAKVDFVPSKNNVSSAITALIDAGMIAERDAQEPRDYLGGSRLGDPCARKLAYEFFHVKPDKGFNGQTLRRFERGHHCETRMARYLRLAGFQLSTEKAPGKQYNFGVARDPETGRNRIAGNLDGVFAGGPDILPGTDLRLVYPFLWENKGLNGKGVASLHKHGLAKEYPVYFSQMQVYMAYMGLTDNPGLFTAEDQDDCTIYAELVPFDLASAQEASDRGVRVVSASSPAELPRIAGHSDDFRCRFCSFNPTCWAETEPVQIAPAMPVPAWLNLNK
jgi:hypothetical protein